MHLFVYLVGNKSKYGIEQITTPRYEGVEP